MVLARKRVRRDDFELRSADSTVVRPLRQMYSFRLPQRDALTVPRAVCSGPQMISPVFALRHVATPCRRPCEILAIARGVDAGAVGLVHFHANSLSRRLCRRRGPRADVGWVVPCRRRRRPMQWCGNWGHDRGPNRSPARFLSVWIVPETSRRRTTICVAPPTFKSVGVVRVGRFSERTGRAFDAPEQFAGFRVKRGDVRSSVRNPCKT